MSGSGVAVSSVWLGGLRAPSPRAVSPWALLCPLAAVSSRFCGVVTCSLEFTQANPRASEHFAAPSPPSWGRCEVHPVVFSGRPQARSRDPAVPTPL